LLPGWPRAAASYPTMFLVNSLCKLCVFCSSVVTAVIDTLITGTQRSEGNNPNALAPEEPNIYRHGQPLRTISSVGATCFRGSSDKTNAICRSYGAPETLRESAVYKYSIPTGLVECGKRLLPGKQELASLFHRGHRLRLGVSERVVGA